MVNNLFLNYCYLDISKSYLNQKDIDILIIAEDYSLLQAIQKLCNDNGEDSFISKLGKTKRRINFISRYLKATLEMIVYSLNGLKSWKINFALFSKKKVKPCIILHTYFSPNTINKKGKLKDIYFPNLREWLVENGKEVFLLPVMSGFSDSSDAFRKLRTTNINHINPSEHLSPIDYLKGMYRFFQSVNLPKRNFPISINSLDCTPLFEGAKRAFIRTLLDFYYARIIQKNQGLGIFLKL